ncbi:hypothetical protein Tco_1195905 [Tanacetum coccineum]
MEKLKEGEGVYNENYATGLGTYLDGVNGPGKLFSNIVKPSDSSRAEETNMSSGSSTALPTGGTTSFANVILRAKSVEAKAVEIGKKASRVLLSTSVEKWIAKAITADNYISIRFLFLSIKDPANDVDSEPCNELKIQELIQYR